MAGQRGADGHGLRLGLDDVLGLVVRERADRPEGAGGG